MKPTTAINSPEKLKLAVIGGGRRCLSMLKMLESQSFLLLKAEVAGVVDKNPEAMGCRLAREKGIFTCADPDELWQVNGLDLIVEFTGDQDILNRLATKRPSSVRMLGSAASQLLHDVINLAGQLEENQDQMNLAKSLSHLLIGHSSEGMLLLDPDYRILRANHAALKSAGLTSQEAVGLYCYQVSHGTLSPCHTSETPCPMRSTLTTGESAHAIHEHVQLDGSSVFCDVSTYPLLNQKGEVVQVLEVFRDITKDLAQRMEARTRAMRHNLARMVQEDRLISLGKLVASVAHEINNPIGSILNFNKLMEKGIQEGRAGQEQLDTYADWLKLSIQEAERVKYIVRNLLSFARQGGISQQPVDLAQIVRATLELTEHHINLAGVGVEVDMPQGQLVVQGDSHQLQQVVTNLLLNSLEAMEQDGQMYISGSISEDGNEAVLEIRDNGVGIPPENLDKIFEPFFTTKDASSGTGLGLSVVYGIVRQHRGEVEVESLPGQGAFFRLSFPIQRDEGPKQADGDRKGGE
jgi:two-component system NtrC family sensor kinase